jgi:hypothetical protein
MTGDSGVECMGREVLLRLMIETCRELLQPFFEE